jgi:prefoldin subunit 2
METIKDLEDDRKCWRLVNGVLFEKPKGEVMPELKVQVANIENVVKQLSDAL